MSALESTSRGTRFAGTGRSANDDARCAGREAAAEALQGRSASLLIVFASVRFDLTALLAGVGEVADDTPVIGCSSAGEIAASGPGNGEVVIFAIGGDGLDVATAVACDASADLRAAGARAATALDSIPRRTNRVLLLLADSLAGDQQEIVRGAYAHAGPAVPLVGGCAGDDLAMVRTSQFSNGDVLTDSVVAAAISSDGPIGIGVRHGFRPVGRSMLVTEADGNRVIRLDGRPAVEVYLEVLGADPALARDVDRFREFAMLHPLGLARRVGEPHVRFVGTMNPETGELGAFAAVPEGATVRAMAGSDDSVLAATSDACAEALDGFDGPPVGVLAFDCIARRGVLGETGIRNEIDALARLAGGAPVAGFYTYGEIARTAGISGFHNDTLVVLALG